MDAKRLDELLNAFPLRTVGLLGDLFLDRYLWLRPGEQEMSIETGREAYQVTAVRNSPGALGTVMNNLAALGVGKLVPVTVIGDDGHGYDLLRSMEHLPLDAGFIVRSAQRLTPTYTKPMRSDEQGNWYELNRLDVRTRSPLEADISQQLCDSLRAVFAGVDGLIVLDQISEPECGVVSSAVRRVLAELQENDPQKLIFIDSRSQLGDFHFGTLKGNQDELLRAAGQPAGTAGVRAAAQLLAARTRRHVFATLGEQGMLIGAPDGAVDEVAGFPVQGPVDIVGAGDAASSALVATLLSGGTPQEAALLANLAASITVQQLGTTGTASPAQIRSRWQQAGLR